jgi:hypothetical protein
VVGVGDERGSDSGEVSEDVDAVVWE